MTNEPGRLTRRPDSLARSRRRHDHHRTRPEDAAGRRRTTARRPTSSTRNGSSTATGSTSDAPRRVPTPGSWLRVEIGGESVLVVRGKDERIRGFYNVCRHRGSRICDDEQGVVRTHLRCPYHAWGYALDGTLVTTPMIEKDEIDRASTSLWPVARRGLGGVRLRQPLPRGAQAPARAPRRPAGRDARAGPVRPGRPAHRPRHHQRRAGQLEDRDRELQRVPALPGDPSRAGRRRAGVPEGQHLRERSRATAASPWPTAARRSSTTRDCGCRCCRASGPGEGDPQSYYGAGSTPRCSSTSTGPAAWPPRCSRPARRAADW